jgi:hypothetical protein
MSRIKNPGIERLLRVLHSLAGGGFLFDEDLVVLQQLALVRGVPSLAIRESEITKETEGR